VSPTLFVEEHLDFHNPATSNQQQLNFNEMASSTIALGRALTQRIKRNRDGPPGGSVRLHGRIDRTQISLPTELISTTNVHAHTYPDLAPNTSVPSFASSGSSINSAADSDFSADRGYLSTPGTSVDSSSIESSPITPNTDELKGFFDNTPKRSATSTGTRTSDDIPAFETPAIPKRALSHSKKAHVELSRKRSVQRMSPPPNTMPERPSSRSSAHQMFNAPTDPDHPFGKELAQVNEVAEEFGATQTLIDEEEQELLNKGFKKFGVNDYLDEIADLYNGGVFEGNTSPLARLWF